MIGYPYQENIPKVDITAMFAKESLLKANADAAKRFELEHFPLCVTCVSQEIRALFRANRAKKQTIKQPFYRSLGRLSQQCFEFAGRIAQSD